MWKTHFYVRAYKNDCIETILKIKQVIHIFSTQKYFNILLTPI